MLDAVLITATVFVAAYGRNHFVLLSTAEVSRSAALVGAPLVLAWLATIALRGGYDRGVFGAGADEYKTVVGSSYLTAASRDRLYLVQFELSRGFFVFTFLIGPARSPRAATPAPRLHRARRVGSLTQRTVIVGGADHVDAVASVFGRESWLGYHVSAPSLLPGLHGRTDVGVPVLGDAEESAALVLAYGAEVIFFAGGGLRPTRRCASGLGPRADDVQVIIAPDVTDMSSERIRVRPVGGLPLLHVDPPRWRTPALGEALFDSSVRRSALAFRPACSGRDPDQVARRWPGGVPSGPRRS